MLSEHALTYVVNMLTNKLKEISLEKVWGVVKFKNEEVVILYKTLEIHASIKCLSEQRNTRHFCTCTFCGCILQTLRKYI